MSIGGTFGTMRESIKAELGRDRNFDDILIKLEIARAINLYRWERFWFNLGSFSFTAAADAYEFEVDNVNARNALTGPPPDVLGIIRMESRDSCTPSCSREIDASTIDEVRDEIGSRGSGSGYPLIYAFTRDTSSDAGNTLDTLIFAPRLDTAYTIYADYIQDIGTPRAYYDGSDWVFEDPDGDPLDDSYTNAWFTDGESLIRNAVKTKIFAGVLFDDSRAQVTAQLELDAKQKLRNIGNTRKQSAGIRPFW